MKKIILLIIFFNPSLFFSQEVNLDLHGYTEIINIPNKNNEQLYNKLKEWIALNYNSSNDVLQLDSKDKLIIKGNFSYFSSVFNNEILFNHTLILSIKDSRCKVDLIVPDKVIVTRVYGKEIETNVFEEELRNTVTYNVLLKRFSDSYKNANQNEKNYTKKYQKALNKNKEVLKNRTLVFKKEFSNNLNERVNSIYMDYLVNLGLIFSSRIFIIPS